jgi:hypothetical protein
MRCQFGTASKISDRDRPPEHDRFFEVPIWRLKQRRGVLQD